MFELIKKGEGVDFQIFSCRKCGSIYRTNEFRCIEYSWGFSNECNCPFCNVRSENIDKIPGDVGTCKF